MIATATLGAIEVSSSAWKLEVGVAETSLLSMDSIPSVSTV